MIICCGEALIDLIPGQTAQGQSAYVPLTGGAIFNTSVALGRLGVPTALLSGVSTDSFGALLVRTLAENNVNADYLVRWDCGSELTIKARS